MERSKQLAVMFALGAVLVGGVLGFSADRVFWRSDACTRWWSQHAMRQCVAESLELTPAQQARVDSILDARNARVDSLLRPVRPQLDAIRDSARAEMERVFTPEQRARFEQMHLESRKAKEHKQ